jgi:hypothetical protein
MTTLLPVRFWFKKVTSGIPEVVMDYNIIQKLAHGASLTWRVTPTTFGPSIPQNFYQQCFIIFWGCNFLKVDM